MLFWFKSPPVFPKLLPGLTAGLLHTSQCIHTKPLTWSFSQGTCFPVYNSPVVSQHNPSSHCCQGQLSIQRPNPPSFLRHPFLSTVSLPFCHLQTPSLVPYKKLSKDLSTGKSPLTLQCFLSLLGKFTHHLQTTVIFQHLSVKPSLSQSLLSMTFFLPAHYILDDSLLSIPTCLWNRKIRVRRNFLFYHCLYLEYCLAIQGAQ